MKLFLGLLLSISYILSVSAHAEVSYRINLTKPEHQLAKVSVTFPETKNQLLISLPVWRTGKYQQLPLADGIRMLMAVDDSGKQLHYEYQGQGQWLIYLPKPTIVTVSYQLHGNLLEQRVRHIDDSHAFLNASGVFIYSPKYRQSPISIRLKVPKGWKSYSGMKRGKKSHSFIADNYDELVDSPIETGINKRATFSANSIDYELVVWGQGNYDIKKIKKDLTRLSKQASSIWHDYPFERYVYMIHATSDIRGATEHQNSTIIQVPRFKFRQRQDYLRFIATASHEFIHSWNVKAYRPKGLVPYRYQQPNISELLWIAEGSTSYFQYQLLLRAGIVTPQELLADLAKKISASLQTPGKEQQSIAEASQMKWVSTGGDYGINHSVNIYAEGFLTSWALDFDLLKQSKLKSSYRDVHRLLYRNFKLPRGYTVNDVQGILYNLTGKNYQNWWHKHVNSPISLDYKAMLKQAGLAMSYGENAKQKIYAGLTFAPNSLVIKHVQRNSPAWQAGIHAGDEIIAIDDLKLASIKGAFEQRINDYEAGDDIRVALFRNQTLIKKNIELGEKYAEQLQIVPLAKASSYQKAFFKAWLGIDWPFDSK